jgi:RNA polymerase sigma-54 factor
VPGLPRRVARPLSLCATPADRHGGGPDHGIHSSPETAAIEPDTDLVLQAVRVETSAADAPIVEYVVNSLDRHGLLDLSCAQLAADLGVAESAVARVLDLVRQTGPPGVGATSVSECLLLQLDALGLDENRARLSRAVIAEHLPALARGRFASIAAALGSPAPMCGRSST